MDFKAHIEAKLKDALGKATIVEIPPESKMGDFAFPCFPLAKEWGKAPVEIAKELAQKIDTDEYLQEIKTIGPYLNFFINKDIANKQILTTIAKQKEHYGKGDEKEENIMIEYCQVNTHKSFHVGHLRGTLTGSALVSLYHHLGFSTISANYQGDVGAHVAKSLWYITQQCHCEFPKQHKGTWLGTIYQKANALLSSDQIDDEKKAEYKKQVSEVLQKLEAGDPEIQKLWNETRQWSLDDFEDFYKMIGVSFDNYFFESEVEKPGKELVEEMKQSGLAVESEGALLVDLEEYHLGKFLVLKSDGTSLYSTKDIALAKRKFEEFNIHRAIYVVGSEQKFYFQQLFKTIELMGFEHAKNCYHVPFELVTLTGGKISSREGELILAKDLVEEGIKTAHIEVQKRHEDWDEKQVQTSAKNIALSAIKFTMLNQNVNKQLVFDMKKALDFEGETGPYIQYTHARLCSILRKANHTPSIGDIDFSYLKEQSDLITLLGMFPEMVSSAALEYKPNTLCRYLLDLAQKTNEFYHDTPILKIEDEQVKNARLFLVMQVQHVLGLGLSLLGIVAPEEM